MTKVEEQRAAELLGQCKTLSDAEKYFGGVWDPDAKCRNVQDASVSWGLFDGWHDRPLVPLPPNMNEQAYNKSYRTGRKLALERLAF